MVLSSAGTRWMAPKSAAALLLLAFAGTEGHATDNPCPQTENIVAVQASSALSGRINQTCVEFDRLSTPPFATSFVIPDGDVFVMTSVDWTGGAGSRASKSVLADFFIYVGGGVNGPSAMATAIADSDGTAGGTITFPSGVVVKKGQQLCVEIQTVPDSNSYAPADAVAHGYFAHDSH
jgi:hypothetical protein